MSIFDEINSDESAEAPTDSVGGGGFIAPTDVYTATIEAAYAIKSRRGALGLSVILKLDNGMKLRETFYLSNSSEKGQKDHFVKDGKKILLPGFMMGEKLAKLTVGKGIKAAGASVEKKTIKLYDFDAGKEVPTEVDMVMDLVGQQIKVAVEEQLVDKVRSDGSGGFSPTGETKKKNECKQFFHAETDKTLSEVLKDEDAEFMSKWIERNKGKVKDKVTDKAAKATLAGNSNVASGLPAAKSATAPAGEDIFGS